MALYVNFKGKWEFWMLKAVLTGDGARKKGRRDREESVRIRIKLLMRRRHSLPEIEADDTNDYPGEENGHQA